MVANGFRPVGFHGYSVPNSLNHNEIGGSDEQGARCAADHFGR